MNSHGQHYVALCVDYPIPGVPSIRVYGPFDESADAVAELAKHAIPDSCQTGYLLLRGPDEIAKEVVSESHATTLASMRLNRRMEFVFGGPSRPFPLTVKEADVLGSAVETLAREQAEQDVLNPPADDSDAQADAELQRLCANLARRLRGFSGYLVREGPDAGRG